MSEFDVKLLSFSKNRSDRPDLVTVSYDGRELGHHEAGYDTWEARNDGTLNLLNSRTGDLWCLWFDMKLATTAKFPSDLIGFGKIDPESGRISAIDDMIQNCASAESQRVVIEDGQIRAGYIKAGGGLGILDDHLVSGGTISASSLTIHQPKNGPQHNILYNGHPLNHLMNKPAKLDGFIIGEAGRDELDRIYVVADCAITGKTVRLNTIDLIDVDKSEIDRVYVATIERLTAERDDTNKRLDVAHKLNQRHADRIASLEAQLTKLTPQAPEPEWVQPAEVGSGGQPRSGRDYHW